MPDQTGDATDQPRDEASASPGERRIRRVRIALASVSIGLLAHLILGDNPWSEGVVESVQFGELLAYRDTIPYLWWGSLINLFIVAGLYASAPRWLSGQAEPRDVLAPDPGRTSRGFRAAIAAAILVSAVLGLPRLSHSLWGDEAYSASHSIIGNYYVSEEGEIRHHKVKWRDTFFFYYKPNNHVPFSILSRLSTRIWLAVAQPEEVIKVEPAIRFPAFLAGLASIAVTALCVRRLGFAWAGLIAAWILALHPWHLRYATEGRCYAFVLLLVPMLFSATLRVLQHGTGRRWAAYGGLQALLLWMYPAALVIVAPLNLFVLWELRALHKGANTLVQQVCRWLASCTIGAAVFIELMTPNLLQFGGYLNYTAIGKLGWPWIRDTLSFLFAGMPWGRAGNDPVHPELVDLVAAQPLASWGLLALVLAGTALGAARLVRSGRFGAGLLGFGMVIPPVALYLGAAARGNYLYHWYEIFALTSATMLLAIGLETLFAGMANRRRAAIGVAGLTTLLLAGHTMLTTPARQALRERSFQSIRESVEATGLSMNPYAPQNREILVALAYEGSDYYDAFVTETATADELLAMMEESRSSGKPLRVVHGRRKLLEQRRPDVAALLDRPELFEEVVTLPAFGERWTRYVFSYTGATP